MHLGEIQQEGHRSYPFIMFAFVKYWNVKVFGLGLGFFFPKGSVVAIHCRVVKIVRRQQVINGLFVFSDSTTVI